MREFTRLLDALAFQTRRNEKIRLLVSYFQNTPDPDRGYALSILTSTLDLRTAKPALLRSLVEERVDGELFRLSYDYVGDLAETISLIWPAQAPADKTHKLSDVIETIQKTGKSSLPQLLTSYLDTMTAAERWAFIKMMTGGLRVGVSARLTKTALAQLGDKDVAEIEELWHGLTPPFDSLFAWLTGQSEKPVNLGRAQFRPVMLAHALDEKDLEKFPPENFSAEWKWDGIRIQATADGDERRLYSRTGDDISAAFEDVLSAIAFDGTIDGELLIVRDGVVAPFNDLQKRLNRKKTSSKLVASHPAMIFSYDALRVGDEDIRTLPFSERRTRLEAMIHASPSPKIALSPMVDFDDWATLAELRTDTLQPGVEGLMLKRWASPYLTGRPKGHWYKWKRDPFVVDAVLLYAQRGHGKRSSFYSDFTFGVWREGDLVPVGKAYFGFTDEELAELDKFIRNRTINRFGPVREVVHEPEDGFVVEVAFEGLQRSSRHKSGLAMRFPRISRLRRDKLPKDADQIETLDALLNTIETGQSS